MEDTITWPASVVRFIFYWLGVDLFWEPFLFAWRAQDADPNVLFSVCIVLLALFFEVVFFMGTPTGNKRRNSMMYRIIMWSVLSAAIATLSTAATDNTKSKNHFMGRLYMQAFFWVISPLTARWYYETPPHQVVNLVHHWGINGTQHRSLRKECTTSFNLVHINANPEEAMRKCVDKFASVLNVQQRIHRIRLQSGAVVWFANIPQDAPMDVILTVEVARIFFTLITVNFIITLYLLMIACIIKWVLYWLGLLKSEGVPENSKNDVSFDTWSSPNVRGPILFMMSWVFKHVMVSTVGFLFSNNVPVDKLSGDDTRYVESSMLLAEPLPLAFVFWCLWYVFLFLMQGLRSMLAPKNKPEHSPFCQE
jgi:hypothetical protein